MCEVCECARFWCIAFTPASKLALTMSIILAEVGIILAADVSEVADRYKTLPARYCYYNL